MTAQHQDTLQTTKTQRHQAVAKRSDRPASNSPTSPRYWRFPNRRQTPAKAILRLVLDLFTYFLSCVFVFLVYFSWVLSLLATLSPGVLVSSCSCPVVSWCFRVFVSWCFGFLVCWWLTLGSYCNMGMVSGLFICPIASVEHAGGR